MCRLLELATVMALESLPGVFTECANQPIIQTVKDVFGRAGSTGGKKD